MSWAAPAPCCARLRGERGKLIEKPYKEQELLAAVARGLDLRAQERRRNQGQSDALALVAKLSPRELQILRGLLASLSNKAIECKTHSLKATIAEAVQLCAHDGKGNPTISLNVEPAAERGFNRSGPGRASGA